jgi:acyl-CoA synthetase (AMP-forming)/AMP-acid ligase II
VFANVASGISHNAARRPAYPALIDGDRVISYAELDRLIGRAARQLLEAEVRPRDIVGVALPDTASHVAALFAIARLGAVILPMDRRWTAFEKGNLARFFGTKCVLQEEGAEPLPDVPTLVMDASAETAREPGTPAGPVLADADAPLMLSLSSGTTGTPKGPLISHRQLQERFLKHWVSLTFNEHDRHMIATPLYFGGGRIFAMSHLCVGATVVLFPPPYKADELLAALQRHRITTVYLVPTLLRRLLELPGERPILRSLRLLISGGAALYPGERRAIKDHQTSRFVNYYSSSEGGPVSVLLPEHEPDGSGCVGRAVFLTEVEVVDEAQRRLPPGLVGRVRYRGPGVAQSFFKNPEESETAFRDGWFYPGDLGYLDADGFLYLSGRSKDVIIRGGVNIYPGEIEETLLRHPAVQDVAVVRWPSREFGEEIAAFVVKRHDVDPVELLEHCRRVLAPYKVPRAVFFLDSLPKSSMGKVDKAKLVETLKSL